MFDSGVLWSVSVPVRESSSLCLQRELRVAMWAAELQALSHEFVVPQPKLQRLEEGIA